jgi:hypothetical protein
LASRKAIAKLAVFDEGAGYAYTRDGRSRTDRRPTDDSDGDSAAPAEDKIADPIGVKGLGELVIVGVPAAIANAVFNATGKRVTDLPITVEKLL